MAKPSSRKRAASAPTPEGTYVNVDERRARGKALREAVPRVTHGGWKAQRVVPTRRVAEPVQ